MLQKIPSSIGEALQHQRAGFDQTVIRRVGRLAQGPFISVSSSAFASEGPLPVIYTADGTGRSPPLQWRGIPEEATSIALIVEDADAPTPHPLVHAIVVNLDTRESSIAEGALESPEHKGVGLAVGLNSFLSHQWLPPDPPPGHGVHRYVFQLFALRGPAFDSAPGRDALVRVIEARGLAAGSIIATYERAQRVPIEKEEETVDSDLVPA